MSLRWNIKHAENLIVLIEILHTIWWHLGAKVAEIGRGPKQHTDCENENQQEINFGPPNTGNEGEIPRIIGKPVFHQEFKVKCRKMCEQAI